MEMKFVNIIKRLMSGSYETMTGHPDAPKRFEEFVKEIREKIPELAGKDDWEVEDTVLEAIDFARHKLCKPIRTAEYAPTGINYYEGVAVYSCYHPSVGNFYLTVQEEEDGDTGYGFFGFTLTRDKREAMRLYKSVVKEWKERGIKYEEW